MPPSLPNLTPFQSPLYISTNSVQKYKIMSLATYKSFKAFSVPLKQDKTPWTLFTIDLAFQICLIPPSPTLQNSLDSKNDNQAQIVPQRYQIHDTTMFLTCSVLSHLQHSYRFFWFVPLILKLYQQRLILEKCILWKLLAPYTPILFVILTLLSIHLSCWPCHESLKSMSTLFIILHC